ncbi:condensation domain-containing protein [Paenactinomyces guangxiensis]|uniref:Condensation domain-containing protein n=1 Tax=Paenactinomyces guangxiensis TaxID=1490290 RepID=A0A7W1WSF3_9BACL|nr:condensation domain-containing protein [Paenactinomyces guangxiensis]MBA4495180.1 hypothetical protein [Paenactinomyces guangxiensis]MBH8592136.1 hypothetical protein [Paenactinomyces guangxiensis]
MAPETTNFDLSLSIAFVRQKIQASFTYNKDLFYASTMKVLASRFLKIILLIINNPELRLHEIVEHLNQDNRKQWLTKKKEMYKRGKKN